jgi:hypothetical protein
MPDEKASRAAHQGYEVKAFASKYKLTADQARQLIAEVGNDRERLDAAAAKLKKR